MCDATRKAGKFGFDCIIYLAKTKTLISCAVTVKLICTFVFAYAESRNFREVVFEAMMYTSVVNGY